MFVDSRKGSFNIDEERVMSSVTSRTKGVIVSALYGVPFDAEFYKVIKKKRRIFLIGDYAHGLLTYITKQKGQLLDILDLLFFSFGLRKEITFMGGGAMITNSDEVFERVRDSRDTLCKKSDLKVLMKTMVRFFASYIFIRAVFYRFLYLMSEKTRLVDTQRGLIGINLPSDFLNMPSNFQLNLALDRLKNIRIFIEDKKSDRILL